MNLSLDLIKLGKRIDNRTLSQSKDYKITQFDKEVTVESVDTLYLLSLQLVKTENQSEKKEKGFLKVYGCDNKVTEIYKKCINFDKIIKNDTNFYDKIFIKVRILEGNSLEGICLGINRLLEVNEVPVLYYPEVFVYSMNESLVRDPTKNELDGCLVVAKAKGIILYVELSDSSINSCKLKECLNETNKSVNENLAEKSVKKVKR